MKKIILSIFAILLGLCYLSKAQTILKTNFSGTWVIDLAKSQFGEIPAYTANKQLNVLQTAETLRLERLTVNDAGADSTAKETLPLHGNSLVITGGDHRQRTITAKIPDDGNSLTIRIIVSEPDEPETVAFDSNETWTLNKADQTLVIKKTVKVTDGEDYAVRAVYNKK